LNPANQIDPRMGFLKLSTGTSTIGGRRGSC
jgi:hypothetical protein